MVRGPNGKNRIVRYLGASGLMAGLLSVAAPSVAATNLGEFLTDGSLLLNARYRYEHVDQSGFSKAADAHTVRLRAGYRTPVFHGLQGLLEIQATGHLSDTFNDTVNGHTDYPVIPDPENVQLNRLQLRYTDIPDTALTLGRQEINLDDQRFIGAVGFRQNEQTFDAVRIDNSSIPGLSLTYIYLDRVNRVFGVYSSQSHFSGDVHLINAAYDLSHIGKLTAYAYLLGLDNAPSLSTQTYGASLAGRQPFFRSTFLGYRLEGATQQPYSNNPKRFDLTYLRGELGLSSDLWSAMGGVEYLDGNNAIGFSTPLATLHKFQGFADVFLTTPASGIVDTYGELGMAKKLTLGAISGVALSGWYHDFANPHGGALGSEFDLDATLKFGRHVSTSLTYANYDGVKGYASRDRIWFTVEMSN